MPVPPVARVARVQVGPPDLEGVAAAAVAVVVRHSPLPAPPPPPSAAATAIGAGGRSRVGVALLATPLVADQLRERETGLNWFRRVRVE